MLARSFAAVPTLSNACRPPATARRVWEPVTHLQHLDGTVMLGGSGGGVHAINLATGALQHAAQRAADHEGPLTGLHACAALGHFVTSGRDGMVKVRPA